MPASKYRCLYLRNPSTFVALISIVVVILAFQKLVLSVLKLVNRLSRTMWYEGHFSVKAHENQTVNYLLLMQLDNREKDTTKPYIM